MQILIPVCYTFILLLGLVWTLFTGGFGLANFTRDHGRILSALAIAAWVLLFLVHPYSIYKVWSEDVELWQWILLPAVMHVIFFGLFGRNVSTQ